MSETKRYLLWEELDFLWEDIDMLWEDIAVVVNAGRKIGSTLYADPDLNKNWKKIVKKLDEGKENSEESEKFIKVVCKINNIEYTEIMKPNTQVKVTLQHFERVFEKAKVKVTMTKK